MIATKQMSAIDAKKKFRFSKIIEYELKRTVDKTALMLSVSCT